MTKARLRSRSTFSPLEHVLEKSLQNYMLDLEASQNESNATHRYGHWNSAENIYDTAS